MKSLKEIVAVVKDWFKKVWKKIGIDGLLHTEVCFAFCVTTAAVFNLFCPRWVAIIVGALSTALVGVIKEFYDKAHPESHTAEWKDLCCDFVGIAFAIIVICML